MRHRLLAGLFGAVLSLFWACAPGVAQNAPATPNYARDIRPILQARCVVCHNRAALKNPPVSGGLALETFGALKQGVNGRAVFTAGKSAESELYRRLLASSPTRLMPKGGPPLAKAQIALVKQWLEAGAPAGDLSKEGANAATAERPMPPNPGAKETRLPTALKPAPAFLPKGASADSALTVALKVGPLPPIVALAYSPDGALLAVGGYRNVTLWNTQTGKVAASITHLPGAVQAIAFRPDGAQFAVAGGEAGVTGETRLYDAKTFAPIGAPLTGHADLVYSVAWNQDGTRLATASQDKTTRLWELPSGKELRVFKEASEAVYRVCFAPDGKSLYAAGQDRTIRRYNLADGTLIRAIAGHENGVNALAVNANGSRIVTSGQEARLRWWNPEDGTTTNYSDGHSGAVNEIAFSKDGARIASAGADRRIRLWSGDGGFQRELTGAEGWLYATAISPNGKFTAGAGAEGVVRIWETETGRLRLTLCFWASVEKNGTPDFLALTPEGYFEASPAWAKRMRFLAGDQPIAHPATLAALAALRQPEAVQKAWQGAALEPAPLPTEPPKAAPPTAK